ncbi:cysteine desulfurase family protein [Rhodovibrionaceae bacterium A322]
MKKTSCYLDYNATAPLRPEAYEAFCAALQQVGNPSSVHAYGRAARKKVEQARQQVAALAGCLTTEIVFTGGGTEANNLALTGLNSDFLLVSAGEHDSVLQSNPARELLPLLPSGLLDLDHLRARLQALSGKGSVLVSVMLANNETGVLQPLSEIAAVVKEFGGWLHCDAIQAAGKIPLDFTALGLDLMTLSAHKLGGPQGVGALIFKEALPLKPLVKGGGQEKRRRAGTENVAGIAAFGAAAAAALRDLPEGDKLAIWRDTFEADLLAAAPLARVVGKDSPRLPNTSCVTMAGVKAETQVIAFDLAGLAVSSGSACSSGKVTVSHVLSAMGLPEEEAASALRISLGWDSREEDLQNCLKTWLELYHRKVEAAKDQRKTA